MVFTALVFGFVGAAAQMVDGTLGMGFGVTSATLLTVLGYSAVAASAGTVMLVLAVPGAIGAFVGAVILTGAATQASRLWMAVVLFLLGLLIIARFGFGRSLLPAIRVPTRHLWPVGLIGGFVDATGGGGWGPVATPSLLTLTRHEPHRVVGTVNAAEFIVAVSASAGGGALVAPFAAGLAHRAPTAILGVCVGGMVLVANTAVIAKTLGVPGPVGGTVVAVIIGATAVLAVRVHARREPEAKLVPVA